MSDLIFGREYSVIKRDKKRFLYWFAIIAIFALTASCKTAGINVLNSALVVGAEKKNDSPGSDSGESWRNINCIAVGKVEDISGGDDFLHLDRRSLVRKALYGHLAPRDYRDVELSVVDRLMALGTEPDNNGELLEKLDCDALLRAEITKFGNEFYVAYSATRVGLAVELFNRKNEVIWSTTNTARSDAGAIPLSPFGLAAGLFFATRNKHDEIAFRMIDTVARQVMDSLPTRISNKISIISPPAAIEVNLTENSLSTVVKDSLEKGEFGYAMSQAEELILLDKKNDVAYFFAGKAALGLGEIEKSKDFFLRAIKLDKEKYEYYNGVGLAYLKNREPSKAREYFSKALKIRNRDSLANLAIGESYEIQRAYAMAAKYYFEAGAIAVTNNEYSTALRSLAALERLPGNEDQVLIEIQRLRAILSYNRKLH